jgi:hypothetical protein
MWLLLTMLLWAAAVVQQQYRRYLTRQTVIVQLAEFTTADCTGNVAGYSKGVDLGIPWSCACREM